jgi:ABC-type spermidine/putrescine transport system permease subunit II
MLSVAVTLCGAVTVLILAAMAVAFWRDPDEGLRQTTHRVELLPRVMADRYTAFAILALVLTLHGDLGVLAAFFAVCAFMGFADGLIYARAGHPHIKHTLSGVLSVGALGITLAAMATGGDA